MSGLRKYATLETADMAERSMELKLPLSKTHSGNQMRQMSVDESLMETPPYEPFVVMEELVEKLKIINYEQGFCHGLHHKPISRHYFALPTNPGEQFNCFASLAAWLLYTSGHKIEQPQETDDPNATIAVILDHLRTLGFKPDFPPSKLKTGCGEQCIWVLDQLANHILITRSFQWHLPVYPKEEMDDPEIIEDNESGAEEHDMDDAVTYGYEDFDDDEHVIGLDDLHHLSSQNDTTANGDPANTRCKEILESNVDSSEWKLEVERVLPHLKVTVRTDNKDWRDHIDQMRTYSEAIESSMKETRSQTDRLAAEITRTLEKINSRERYLNQQLHHHLNELRSGQDRLAEVKERYRQTSSILSEKSKHLAEISEELDRVKQEMEERGASMTDGAPLVKIKQAIARTRQETLQMEVRIGLLQHILLRQTVNAKLHLHTDYGTVGAY